MYINKRAILRNVYDICTVVTHVRVSHAQEQSVRIHHLHLPNHSFLPCGLCFSYRAALYSILRNENQRHLDFFSLTFRKCWGCTMIYCWIYFVISRANGKPQRPIRAKKDIYCLDTAEFITVNRSSKCTPRQWSTTTMTLSCISPLRRALPLSFPVRKGCCFKHRRHLNRQEIVYLAKINEIFDYIFDFKNGQKHRLNCINEQVSD